MSISSKQPDIHCSFLGSPCDRKPLEEDEMKVFLAYPYDDKIRGYVTSLCNQESLKGLKLFPWENLSNSAGIIFCKICREILSSRAIVADITYLNQNVLFELGFGIANRKTPILIKEKNRKGRVLDILRDITRVEYDDINALAGRLYRAVFDDFPLSYDVSESEYPMLFFVNAEASMPIKPAINKHLQKFARGFSYRTLVEDSSEILGHRLVNLLVSIEQSDLIICHMVGTDYEGFNEINAHVSFLAGYALGKHKRILILQEHPADRMIDLHQVRREYRNEKEAIQILDSWLEPVRQDREEAIYLAKKSQEYISLHKEISLSLGHPAAEWDTELDAYFIQTQEYLEARRLNRYLFLGRRGSGKTACFLQLYASFHGQASGIVVKIQPSKLQLTATIERLYDQVGREKLTALLEMFWKYIILTEIAIGCRRYLEERPHAMELEFYDGIERLLTEKNITIDSEFDVRFNSMIDEICKPVLENSVPSIRSYILDNFYREYYSELRRTIRRANEQHPMIVLIDNLDKDWNSSNVLQISAMINSLLEVMDQINIGNEFGNCKVITFLRTDIYRLASQYDPDVDKRQPSFLRWDASMLKQLICGRIAQAKRIYDVGEDELWSSVFGAGFENIDNTFNYLH